MFLIWKRWKVKNCECNNNIDSRYRPMTPHHQTPPPLSMRQHDPLHQMRVMEQQRMAQQPQRPSVIAQPPQSPAVRPTVLSGTVCNKLNLLQFNFCCNFAKPFHKTINYWKTILLWIGPSPRSRSLHLTRQRLTRPRQLCHHSPQNPKRRKPPFEWWRPHYNAKGEFSFMSPRQ